MGTLLRTTLIQLSSLRDAAVREIRSGGKGLAARAPSLLRSRRTEVLASLGEIIYELARSGELDLEDFPELAGAIAELEALDSDMRRDFGPDDFEREIARMQNMDEPQPVKSGGVWRPNPDDYDDSGKRVASEGSERSSRAAAAKPSRPARPSRPGGAGHISFVSDDLDEDDDLAEYMHEDDVPGRG